MTEHNNTRLRLDVRFRELTVLRTEEVTPHMRRIVLGGSELAGFDSPGADDHIKLFFPNASGEMVLPVVTAEGRSYPAGKEPSPVSWSHQRLSLIHISEPTRRTERSRMPSSA